MRFWRERERENEEQIVAQIRVLVVGDSSFPLMVWGNHLLCISLSKGLRLFANNLKQLCVQLVSSSPASSSSSIKADSERDFFVELWDVSGHDRYNDCRSLFYSQINGVIFVHDLSQRRRKTNLQKWAAEVSVKGTFSAPLSSGGPGGLPVLYIVIENKADIAAKDGTSGSSGNPVDAARQWVEKQGLLPHSDELPLSESFPSNCGLIMAAKKARYDKEALNKFFPDKKKIFLRRTTIVFFSVVSFPCTITAVRRGEPYKYNTLPTRSLLHYPQPGYNYASPRFSLSSAEESNNGNARSRRMDINV